MNKYLVRNFKWIENLGKVPAKVYRLADFDGTDSTIATCSYLHCAFYIYKITDLKFECNLSALLVYLICRSKLGDYSILSYMCYNSTWFESMAYVVPKGTTTFPLIINFTIRERQIFNIAKCMGNDRERLKIADKTRDIILRSL